MLSGIIGSMLICKVQQPLDMSLNMHSSARSPQFKVYLGMMCECLCILCVQSGVLWEEEVLDGVPQPVRAHRHLHFPAKPAGGNSQRQHHSASSSQHLQQPASSSTSSTTSSNSSSQHHQQQQKPVPCVIGIDLGMAKPASAVAMMLPEEFASKPQSRPWPSMPAARKGRELNCSCGGDVHDQCLRRPHHPGRRQVSTLAPFTLGCHQEQRWNFLRAATAYSLSAR